MRKINKPLGWVPKDASKADDAIVNKEEPAKKKRKTKEVEPEVAAEAPAEEAAPEPVAEPVTEAVAEVAEPEVVSPALLDEAGAEQPAS